MRGSDADAALHYLARMIEAGEDPRFIARRLIVHASEDVGMADPTALQTAVAAAQAVEFVGLPEARINLAQAVIHIALAPKSNAVVKRDRRRPGRRAGRPDRRGPATTCATRTTLGPSASATARATSTRMTCPRASSAQQYAPDAVNGRAYYEPSSHGMEGRFSERARLIREILHPETGRRAGRGSRCRGRRGERARQWGREVIDPRSCHERERERERDEHDRSKREGVR